MQAIILAAGMGKRLKELTQNNTKCMVKVNGITLIDRMLHQLEKHNLDKIVIVIGYEGQKLVDYIGTLGIKTPIVFVDNPIYDKTNNIYSLSLAKDWLLKDDTLLFESDIIFEDEILDGLISDSRDSLVLVDNYEPWMDGTCVRLRDEDDIIDFIPGKMVNFNETRGYYKTVNIYKFSKYFSKSHYVPFLDAYQAALGENEYYEQVLRVIAMLDEPGIKAKRLNGQKWYEIDDIQDLDIAESIFSSNEDERLQSLCSRYGGYWRYPKLLDFCFLVNPFFPPQKMKDEIKASFDTLLTEYPSGMRVNSLLASKNFNVHQENILVGNGAAELIKSLLAILNGKTGFVRPTFEEYPNRYDADNSVYFTPNNADYKYTEIDLITYFEGKGIDNLILVNPDNPSGNYIPNKGVNKLIEWCKKKNIKLVIDESFADFADEENNTHINQKILDDNPHVYVMKSISKSFGVPGLRLGILASGNMTDISILKKDVAIWNINSFAEFYMQIEEKYKKEYEISLKLLRDERKRFEYELSKIDGIRVIPSQANYIMVELTNQISSWNLAKKMLFKHNILIKELTQKITTGDYLRLAIRDKEDNDRLLVALNKEMQE